MWTEMRVRLTALSFFAMALAALGFAACAGDLPQKPLPTPGPADPTPAPRPVSIPGDERSHGERLEWWYYNGHLEVASGPEAGREFGFHFVIFQSLDADGEPVYASQFAITDVTGNEHRLDSRFYAGNAETGSADTFGLQLNDWPLTIDTESHAFSASMDDGTQLELNLALLPGVSPVLQSGNGWFETPSGWSYYYSWPNMPASGSLEIDGERYEITGTGWFDHQWGDFFANGAPGGWQWMGLQLGNGETLMVTETRNPDGTTAAVFGTWSDGDGSTRSLGDGDGIKIEPLDTWTSPTTGAVYPSRWRLVVDELDLDVVIEPVVADQEVTEGVPAAAIYWEGKVRLTGEYQGRPIDQPGYIELTGYADPDPISWRATR